MAEKETEGIGLGPDDYGGGTGLLSNIDAEWTEVRFVRWTYPKKDLTVTAANVILEEEDGTIHDDQYWSIGAKSGLVPNEDGTGLDKEKDPPKDAPFLIHPESNWAHLVRSLIDTGFPKEKIRNDSQVFEGLKTHLIQVPIKREGVAKTPRPDGRVFEDTILVVDFIAQLPWEKKGKKATGKGKTAAKEEKEDEGEDEGAVQAKATELVLKVLEKLDEPVEMKKLSSLVFADMKKANVELGFRNAVVGVVYTEDFLSDSPFWKFEDGMVEKIG